MESPAHRDLKLRAAHLLREHFGCFAIATEVTAPVPRFRIDAAGMSDTAFDPAASALPTAPPDRPRPPRSPRPERTPRTSIFIEAKAARADFLRDARQLPCLLAQRDRLERELAAIRAEFVRELEPALQATAGLLFPALGEWDYARSSLHCHRLLVRELARLDSAIHGTTKFFCVARYQLASRLYILCPPGLVEPAELPTGWGLLWMTPADPSVPFPASQLAPTIIRPALVHSVRDRDIDRTLRSIAAAASRAWLGPRPALRFPTPCTNAPASVQHAP